MRALFTNAASDVVESDDYDNQRLNRKIEYCCGVRIRRSTHLPSNVCERCFDFVAMWYNFRQMCLNSQVYLESAHLQAAKPDELVDSDSAYMEYLFETLQLNTHRCDSNDDEEQEEEEDLQSAGSAEIDGDFHVDYDEEEANGFVTDNETHDRSKQLLPEMINELGAAYEAHEADAADAIEVDQSLMYDDDCPTAEEEEDSMALKVEHGDIDFVEDDNDDFLSPTPSPDPKPDTTTTKRRPGRPRKPDNELKSKRKIKAQKYAKVEQQTEEESTKYMCNLCGNVYPKKAAFNAHMTAHTDYKPHQCEICYKSFRQMGELRAHIRRHTGERPYKCLYCERHFYDRSEKVRHERVHTNTRPYECKECGKTFTHMAILKNHSLMHSGEKNFNCAICLKSFTLPHQLKAHLQTLTHRSKEEQAFASSSSSYMLSQEQL
ncbi:GH18110 [Drosophila grimshawi]|uniref:GH18110 n=2 Tax=Drosophila grimshawi TaxID=7222 RepID=B4JGY8_DROGR|nr:GH18110 [Drosophila grimshawi]